MNETKLGELMVRGEIHATGRCLGCRAEHGGPLVVTRHEHADGIFLGVFVDGKFHPLVSIHEPKKVQQ